MARAASWCRVGAGGRGLKEQSERVHTAQSRGLPVEGEEDGGGGRNLYMSKGRDNRGKGTPVRSLGKVDGRGHQAEVNIYILDRIQKI